MCVPVARSHSFVEKIGKKMRNRTKTTTKTTLTRNRPQSTYGGASEASSLRAGPGGGADGNSAYGYGGGSVSMFSDSIRSEDEAPHWRGGTYGMAMAPSADYDDGGSAALRGSARSRDGDAFRRAGPPGVYPDEDGSQFDQSRAGRSAGGDQGAFHQAGPPGIYPDDDGSQFDQSRAGRSAAMGHDDESAAYRRSALSQDQGDFNHPEPPNVYPDDDDSRFDQSRASHQDRSAAGALPVPGVPSAAHDDDEDASRRSSNVHPDDISTADFSRRGGYRGTGPVIQAFDDESTYAGGQSAAYGSQVRHEEESAAGTANLQPDDVSTADFSRRGGYRGTGPVIQAFDDESTYAGGQSVAQSRPPGQDEQSAAGTSNLQPDDISTADFSRRGGYRGTGPVIQALTTKAPTQADSPWPNPDLRDKTSRAWRGLPTSSQTTYPRPTSAGVEATGAPALSSRPLTTKAPTRADSPWPNPDPQGKAIRARRGLLTSSQTTYPQPTSAGGEATEAPALSFRPLTTKAHTPGILRHSPGVRASRTRAWPARPQASGRTTSPQLISAGAAVTAARVPSSTPISMTL